MSPISIHKAIVSLLAGCFLLPHLSGCVRHEERQMSADLPPIAGPLKVDPLNPRYFSDTNGRIIYLTGSHTWDNLVDRRANPEFDYKAYLDFLQSYNHNFIRLWARESASPSPTDIYRAAYPLPYLRTGPGMAMDGRPKFDLSKFDPAYFSRLRSRVQQAHDRGIYVMVMLFQGFSIHFKGGDRVNPWPGHPFHARNNVNGVDGDANANGQGEEVHSLENPLITALQEAYIRKVVDTVNDLDVLYEISNESPRSSLDWQYHWITFIHDYEKTKDRQNPVVQTFMWDGESDSGRDDNAALLASPADAISPGPGIRHEYRWDPPAADGSKVIISDTDHLWGVGGEVDWAWKSLLRGLNPIFMDPMKDAEWDPVRQALGQTLLVSSTINLANMIPRNELASSGYCLANPGFEYLVYLPSDSHWLESRITEWMNSSYFIWRFSWMPAYLRRILRLSVEVDVSQATGSLQVSWFNPATGIFVPDGHVGGGRKTEFTAPFSGPAVLHLTSSPGLNQTQG